MPVVLMSATSVLVRPVEGADVAASLDAGETFLVVDFGHQWVWGRGERAGTVGYVAASMLALA